MGRANIFLRNPQTIERLAQVDSIVFDKTGTLTAARASAIEFIGTPLTEQEKQWVHSVTRHSTHPHSVRICGANHLGTDPLQVRSFLEAPGCGLQATVAGHEVALGSRQWLEIPKADEPKRPDGSIVHLVIDNIHRGAFLLRSAVRPGLEQLIPQLASYKLSLLSGDNERERPLFERLLGADPALHFQQSPAGKLEYIRALQAGGRTVMMVGDGLNDSGALKQADVGVAVVEAVGAFSPASDIILDAARLHQLAALLRFSHRAVTVVRLSFGISALYNVAGITIAASGRLSPIVCAILMPLSSISVVGFGCLATTLCGYKAGLRPGGTKQL